MTATQPARHSTAASPRVGYAIAALVNVALLFVVNATPGWRALPFVTAEAAQVLALVNAALVAGVLANLASATARRAWVHPLVDVVATGIGVAATVALLRVFPFALPAAGPWDTVARVMLVLAIVGGAIGLVVELMALLRALPGAGGSLRGET